MNTNDDDFEELEGPFEQIAGVAGEADGSCSSCYVSIGIDSSYVCCAGQVKGRASAYSGCGDPIPVSVYVTTQNGEERQITSGTGSIDIAYTPLEGECGTKLIFSAKSSECDEVAKSNTTIVKVDVKSIDVCSDKITFDILPAGLPIGQAEIIVHGPRDISMAKFQLGSANNYVSRFFWGKFPQTPGEEFHATSVEVKWTYSKIACSATKSVEFIGYGKFRITKYITPDDARWDGPTQQVSFNANGTPPYREVHSNWIRRVRGAEGVGMSQDTLYRVRRTNRNASVRYWLDPTNGGACGAGLNVDKTLARLDSDSRFKCKDKIVLAKWTGHCFAIEDSGNWTDDAKRRFPNEEPRNFFDRYSGVAGPEDPDVDYGQSYVVKLL